jgi:hypothetical protein
MADSCYCRYHEIDELQYRTVCIITKDRHHYFILPPSEASLLWSPIHPEPLSSVSPYARMNKGSPAIERLPLPRNTRDFPKSPLLLY